MLQIPQYDTSAEVAIKPAIEVRKQIATTYLSFVDRDVYDFIAIPHASNRGVGPSTVHVCRLRTTFHRPGGCWAVRGPGGGGVVEMTDVIATANHNNITANLGIFAVT